MALSFLWVICLRNAAIALNRTSGARGVGTPEIVLINQNCYSGDMAAEVYVAARDAERHHLDHEA